MREDRHEQGIVVGASECLHESVEIQSRVYTPVTATREALMPAQKRSFLVPDRFTNCKEEKG
jgi:hypothetical protein